MDRTTISPAKGISALELLIIAGGLAVLAAFATSIIGFAKPKSELEQAIEITESSVVHARQAARFYKTDVLMHLEMDGIENQQSIILSIPAMQKDPALSEVKEEYVLPFGFHVFTDGKPIHFDSSGEAKTPAQVLVVSNQAENIRHELVID